MTDNFVIALWDLTADQSDELSFKKGDAILVLRHKNGFYRGQLGDKKGWFQDDYVRKPTPEELAQIQQPTATSPPATEPPISQPAQTTPITPRGRQGRPNDATTSEHSTPSAASSPSSASPVGVRSLSGYSSSPSSTGDRQYSPSPTPAVTSRSGEAVSSTCAPLGLLASNQPSRTLSSDSPFSRESSYGLYRPAGQTNQLSTPSLYITAPQLAALSAAQSSPPSAPSAFSLTSSLPPSSMTTSASTSAVSPRPSVLPTGAQVSSTPSMPAVRNQVVRVSLRVEQKLSGAPAFVSLALDPAMTVADIVQYIAKKISFRERTISSDELVLCVDTKKLASTELAWPHRNEALTLRIRKARAPAHVLSTAVALYSYSCPDRSDVLAFDVGAVLLIHHKLQEEWWIASLNGKRGLIPAPYVKEIEATPTSASPVTTTTPSPAVVASAAAASPPSPSTPPSSPFPFPFTSSSSSSSLLSSSSSCSSPSATTTLRPASPSSSASPSTSQSPAPPASRDSSRSPSADPHFTGEATRLRSGSSPGAAQPHPRFGWQQRHSTEFMPLPRASSVIMNSPLATSDSHAPTLSTSSDGSFAGGSTTSEEQQQQKKAPDVDQVALTEPAPMQMLQQQSMTEMPYMPGMHGWWPNAYNPYMNQMNLMYPGMAPVMGTPFFNPYYNMSFANITVDPHAQQQQQQ